MAFRCIICGAARRSRIRDYIARPDVEASPFRRASMCRCSVCGVAQLYPLPSEKTLADYYAKVYRANGAFGSGNVSLDSFPKDDLWLYHRGLSVADFFRTHVKIPVPSRILDVGAGYGHVLHFLRDVFPKAGLCAAELDENCIAHLKSIGLPVLRPSGDLQKTVGDGFDLIICSHVIEHFINPMDHVREIKGMLRKGGHAYMEVPNCPAKWLKRNSWPDEPHITFFDADTVRDLATRVGFEIVSFHTVGPKLKVEPRPPIEFTRIRRAVPGWMKQVWRSLASGSRQEAVSGHTTKSPGPEVSPYNDFAQYGGQRFWLRLLLRKSH